MSQQQNVLNANGLITVILGVAQIKKGEAYEGSIRIGASFKATYYFRSSIPLDNINEVELRKLKFLIQKILFPTEITSSENRSISMREERDFIFFHNLLYPVIKNFHANPEIVRFNQMEEKNVKSWLTDRSGSMGKPIPRVTIPKKIYLFKIRIGEIPETVLMFTHQKT